MATAAKIKPLAPSARTVVVCCKIPTGLQLQLQQKQPRVVDTPQGPKMVDFYVKGGKVFHVHGPAYPVQAPKGYPKPPMIEGGYALTRGIPADFWEEWLEQNKLASYVIPQDGAEHGMVFAYPSLDDAISAARENDKLLSGMEPLSTDVDKDGRLTDPRVPRPIGNGMTKLGPEPYPINDGGSTSISSA